MTQSQIIQLLKKHHPNRYTAKQISKHIGRPTQNISKQLASLRHFGFVAYEKVVMIIKGTKHKVYVYWMNKKEENDRPKES